MYTPYFRERGDRFLYHYNWQFERPVQVLPTLREMFFLTDMRMPEYVGFVRLKIEIVTLSYLYKCQELS